MHVQAHNQRKEVLHRNIRNFLRKGEFASILLLLAGEQLELGRDHVAELLARIVRISTANTESGAKASATIIIAGCLFSKKRYAEAFALYDQAARMQRVGILDAWIRRADCLIAMGRKSEAEQAWNEAELRIESLPDSFMKFKALADIAERTGNYGHHYEMLIKAMEFCSSDEVVKRQIIFIELAVTATNNLGRPEDGLRWATDCLATSPRLRIKTMAHDWAGRANRALSNLDAAHEHFSLALSARKGVRRYRADATNAHQHCQYRNRTGTSVACFERVNEALF